MITDRRLYREVNFGFTTKLWNISWLYVLLLCGLAGVGYVALYSVGGTSLGEGSSNPWAGKHLLFFSVGLILMLCIAMMDIRLLQKLSWPTYAIAIVLLVLVLSPLGHVSHGAKRWFLVAGVQFQPSEPAKIAIIMVLASWCHKASWERMGNAFFLIVPLLLILVPAGLILKEPNLGTAIICSAVGLCVLWGAGMRWWIFAIGALPLLILYLFPDMVIDFLTNHHVLKDYQLQRIQTFRHPELDPRGAGFNIHQSLIALGSGGMWGKGYLYGSQAHGNFLPEKQTDFIFDSFGEEFGYAGSVALLGLMTAIVLGGMLLAIRCRNQYGRLVSMGVAFNFFMYVIYNIAMITGSIPVGGVPLPLVSSGGTAVVTVMVAFGLLMSAYVHRDVEFTQRDDG